MPANTPITIRPAAVDESMPSVVETSLTPPLGEFLDGLQDVQGVAAQPVELPDHHGVALAHIVQQCC